MQLNHFTFNNSSTSDFGLLVTGKRIFSAPGRKVEKYSVPGRDGDILVELGGYDNIIIQYEIAIIDDFKVNASAIKNWLLSSKGYQRLTDTYDTAHYREGCIYSGIDYITTALNREGRATIEFDCKPQRFLLSGETAQTFNRSGTITNPTLMASKPLVRAYGKGTVVINGTSIHITDDDQYVDINSESQQAYEGNINRNNDIEVDEFPVLDSGENTITLTGINRVEITPRWWEL